MNGMSKEINSSVKNTVVYCHIKLKTRHKIQLRNKLYQTIIVLKQFGQVTVKLYIHTQKYCEVINIGTKKKKKAMF